MERFCDELRWEREQRQVSIEAICAETKISVRYVQALEAGDFKELPGGVFRKGILRSYLKVLGIEDAPWMERFEASLAMAGQSSAASIEQWAEFAQNVRNTRVKTRPETGRRWLGIAGMFGLLMLFGWLVWSMVQHRRLDAARPAVDDGIARSSVLIPAQIRDTSSQVPK